CRTEPLRSEPESSADVRRAPGYVPGARSTCALRLLLLHQGHRRLGLLGGHVRLASLACRLGFLHQARGLSKVRTAGRGGRLGRLRILTPRRLHILAARSLHVLTPRRLHILAARSLYVLAPRRLHVLAARSLHVLAPRRLHVLAARSLHVLAPRRLHILAAR